MSSSIVFADLPDFSHLCCVTLTLQEEEEELRSRQVKTSRELVLLYPDVLASPALESFAEITVVMALKFFQMGAIQMFGTRHRLVLAPPQWVLPGVLQACLSFSVITRLSPRWNKVGLYLVSGEDFVSERGKMDAVRVEWSTSECQLCLKVDVNAIRLPPPALEDLDLPPLVLRRFWTDPDSVLEPSPAGRVWCHVLPSMKKGQIITIGHKLPQGGPFRTYGDLQNHWKSLYGYSLPDLPEAEQVYCSVYFRLVGERLFTYPLSCVRLQQVQRSPRPGQQGVLSSFLSDVSARLQSVCGFPLRLSGKHGYRTGAGKTPVQVFSGDIQLASTSLTSLSLQFPPGPLHVPTVPPPSTEQPPPSKLAPILKIKGPSRQGSVVLLRLRKQKELLAGTIQETGRRTSPSSRSQSQPTAGEAPLQSRLWVPPAPQSRRDPTTVQKQRSEREVKEQPRQHRTFSASGSQAKSGDVEKTSWSGGPPLPPPS